MARLLITYYSRTGNTEQMAELVAAGAREANGIDVDLRPVNEISPEDIHRVARKHLLPDAYTLVIVRPRSGGTQEANSGSGRREAGSWERPTATAALRG